MSRSCFAVLALAFTSSLSAWADTPTWLGGSGNWTDTTKWSGNVLPGASSDVSIDGGLAVNSAVTLSGTRTVHSLVITSGDTLKGSGTLNFTTLANSGTISTGSSLSLTGAIDNSAGVLNADQYGTVYLKGGSITGGIAQGAGCVNLQSGVRVSDITFATSCTFNECTLSNVTLAGASGVGGSSGWTHVENTLTINSSIAFSALMCARPGAHLGGTGTLAFGVSGLMGDDTQTDITIDAGLAVTFTQRVPQYVGVTPEMKPIARLTNNGRIECSGDTKWFSASQLVNHGTIDAKNSMVIAREIVIDNTGGTITGANTIEFQQTAITGGAIINPGTSPFYFGDAKGSLANVSFSGVGVFAGSLGLSGDMRFDGTFYGHYYIYPLNVAPDTSIAGTASLSYSRFSAATSGARCTFAGNFTLGDLVEIGPASTGGQGQLVIVNTGTLTATKTLLINPMAGTHFTNTGVLGVNANAAVTVTGPTANSGVISVAGTMTAEDIDSSEASPDSISSLAGTTTVTGTLSAARIRQSSLSVTGTATISSNSSASVVSTLTVAGTGTSYTGTLDLNGPMVVHNATTVLNGTGALSGSTYAYGSIAGMVQSGANGLGWNGTGITSTDVRNDNTVGSGLKSLGAISGQEYMDTSEVGATTFGGVTVAAADALVKVTYYGDANLDGQVTATDYTLIDNGYTFGIQGSGWLYGDFDYSGSVDPTDYTLIDNAYTFQSGILALPMLQQHAAMFGAAYTAGLSAQALSLLEGTTAVPEPASLGLLAIGAAGLLIRRRK